jgi:hypothetical protein
MSPNNPRKVPEDNDAVLVEEDGWDSKAVAFDTLDRNNLWEVLPQPFLIVLSVKWLVSGGFDSFRIGVDGPWQTI